MTDTPEFQPNGISLPYYIYSTDSRYPEIRRHTKEIERKLAAGEPVYVQIKDERRRGSIGRLKSASITEHSHSNRFASSSSYDYLYISELTVVWDNRSNSCTPYSNDVEYLPDWTGGTVWNWVKPESRPKAPRVIPYDHLGEEIQADQFVCFVHRLYGRISMKFGTVTRLTDKGGVFVKTLKLRDGDAAGTELKALDAKDLIIVSDKLMSRLLMARLGAE
jgi:hypothetical protein